jgi:hypothetical protein
MLRPRGSSGEMRVVQCRLLGLTPRKTEVTASPYDVPNRACDREVGGHRAGGLQRRLDAIQRLGQKSLLRRGGFARIPGET